MVQISETFIRCLLVFGNLNFRQCRKMITDDQNLIHFLTVRSRFFGTTESVFVPKSLFQDNSRLPSPMPTIREMWLRESGTNMTQPARIVPPQQAKRPLERSCFEKGPPVAKAPKLDSGQESIGTVYFFIAAFCLSAPSQTWCVITTHLLESRKLKPALGNCSFHPVCVMERQDILVSW